MLPPIASDFVAGEDAGTALSHASDVEARGVTAILNLLGEHHDDRAAASADADAYVSLVDAIADRGLDARISVKPSQVGLDLGTDAFAANLARVVERASERDVFVWVDMEDHTTTDATLDAVHRHARDGAPIGVCLQANLRRTRDDIERLADAPAHVRLVKGAYDEPADVAYRERSRVDEAYRDLLEYAFREFDDGVAVGSHDPAMIDHAVDLHERYGTGFEVQMLMGVREDAQFELARDHDVAQYVPFGDRWFSYFYRRVRERKGNALFALRAVLGR